ncbi:MAG TPA: VOC family protein, partial [Aggregatilineales bacterium]|nr:VOC family protein [Aggregatilineales bacterium]
MTIQGLHHITLVSANAQRTVDFYTRVLGQRFVKRTVNFDDPGSYHLYFGDEIGRPGSAITFFEWPQAPKARIGIGGTQHFALKVNDLDSLLRWKRRLTDMGIAVQGPTTHDGYATIRFADADGVALQITTSGTATQADSWPTPVPTITGDMALLHGVHHLTTIARNLDRTDAFYRDLLGLERAVEGVDPDDARNRERSWSADGDRTRITVLEHKTGTPARIGIGGTHHFALAVADEATQLVWRDKLIEAGLQVTPVQNRVYFKSIYFSDPDGHIVEIATAGPGFAYDEPV